MLIPLQTANPHHWNAGLGFGQELLWANQYERGKSKSEDASKGHGAAQIMCELLLWLGNKAQLG
jgi:hypothetical protein